MASIKTWLKYFLLTLSRRLAIDSKSVKQTPIDIHFNASIRDSYDHFVKHFYKAMLFSNQDDLRLYAINKAKQLEQKREGLFMELGVFKGRSLNLLADSLRDINKNIFGFDAFQGIQEDWVGHADNPKGFFAVNGKPPKVRKNVILYVGWVQDTLEKFLNDYQNLMINFIHFDMDT